MLRAQAFLRPLLTSTAIWASALLCFVIFCLIVGQTLVTGLSDFPLDYWFTLPENSGRSGGILSILISTLLVLAICLVTAAPIGLATALFLAEFSARDRWYSRGIQISLDVLASVPSIVFGLFGNALFGRFLGMGFSILSGGLTLACMVLPLLIRTIEQSLLAAPRDLRLAGHALSLSRTSLIIHVLLPLAAPGLALGMILALGRAIGETAVLIFTSGYVDRTPESLWDSGRVLAVHIYDLSMNVPGGELNAHRSALTLLMLVLLINGFILQSTRWWVRQRIPVA